MLSTASDPSPLLSEEGTQTMPHVTYRVAISGGQNSAAAKRQSVVVGRLKLLFAWTADDLLLDVLAAVEDDAQRAIEWLNSMTSTVSSDANASDQHLHTASTSASALDTLDIGASWSSSTERGATVLATEGEKSYANIEKHEGRKVVSAGHINDPKNLLRRVPVEPEWRGDNTYFIYRKDALRSARASSRYAKKATRAFQKGEHDRAQALSKKAQEKRSSAQALNAKAAAEIFKSKNSNKSIWSLDLHGLHATEAVDALQTRLSEIEFVENSCSSSPERLEKGTLHLNKFLGNGNTETKLEGTATKQPASSNRLFSKFTAHKKLRVIVGSGSHSPGAPVIPKVIENYLDTQQYNYNKPRPGIITIKPKVGQF